MEVNRLGRRRPRNARDHYRGGQRHQHNHQQRKRTDRIHPLSLGNGNAASATRERWVLEKHPANHEVPARAGRDLAELCCAFDHHARGYFVTANVHAKKAGPRRRSASRPGSTRHRAEAARHRISSVRGGLPKRNRPKTCPPCLGADFTPSSSTSASKSSWRRQRRRPRAALSAKAASSPSSTTPGAPKSAPLPHVPPEDVLRQLDTPVVGQLKVVHNRSWLPSHWTYARPAAS